MNREFRYLGTAKRKKEDGEVLCLMRHRFYHRSPGSIRLVRADQKTAQPAVAPIGAAAPAPRVPTSCCAVNTQYTSCGDFFRRRNISTNSAQPARDANALPIKQVPASWNSLTKHATSPTRTGAFSADVAPTSINNLSVSISVRDEGAGLPADFDLYEAKGLGMRIVTAFAKQVNATIVVHPQDSGTEFVLSIPLDLAP